MILHSGHASRNAAEAIMKKQNLRMLCVLLAMLLLSGCTFRFSALTAARPAGRGRYSHAEDYHESSTRSSRCSTESMSTAATPTSSAITLHRRPLPATSDRWSYYVSAEDYDAFVESTECLRRHPAGDGQIVGRSDRRRSNHEGHAQQPGGRGRREADDGIYAVEGETVGRSRRRDEEHIRGEEDGGHATILRGERKFDVTVKRASVESRSLSIPCLTARSVISRSTILRQTAPTAPSGHRRTARAGRQGARVRPAL